MSFHSTSESLRLAPWLSAAEAAGLSVTHSSVGDFAALCEWVRASWGVGAPICVGVGGDGTWSALAGAVLAQPDDARPLAALLPMGTGNDWASATGIYPIESPEAYWDRFLAFVPQRVDVGRVELRRGGEALSEQRLFVNAISMGEPAIASAETPDWLKTAFGRVAYGIAGALKLPGARAFEVAVSADGLEWEGRAYYLALANGNRVGGGTVVSPDAPVADGKLDLLIVPEQEDLSKLDIARAFRDLRAGKETPLIRKRIRRIEVAGAADIPLTLDGEVTAASGVRVHVQPGALLAWMPARPHPDV